MPIDLTGHRKLIALGVLVLIGFLCVLFMKDVPTNFASLLQFGFGTFIAGNAVSSVAGCWGGSGSGIGVSPGPQASDDFDVRAALTELKIHDQATHEALANTQAAVATVQQSLAFIITKTGLDKSPPAPNP